MAVLLFVGLSGTQNIRKNKRLQKFDERDYEILTAIVDEAAGVVVSPNVLTETSNLVRYMTDPALSRVIETMSLVIEKSTEIYVAGVRAIRREEYRRLGMTDAVLLEMLNDDVALVTDDMDLYLAAEKAGLPAVSFTHLRDQRPDFR